MGKQNKISNIKDDINRNSVILKPEKLENSNNKRPINEAENLNKNNIDTNSSTNRLKRFKKKIKVRSNDIKQMDSTSISHERCDFCHQYLENVHLYNGHPNNSRTESVVLTDPALSVFKGDEYGFTDRTDLSTYRITHFSVYDQNGHLCSFDNDLMNLHLSGYIKRIDDDDPSIETGIPTHDLGPILGWWATGFDVTEKLLITLSTQYGEYYLLAPSPEYEIIFNPIKQKPKLAKRIIEYLTKNAEMCPMYFDLIEHLENTGEFESVEELLLHNVQYVYAQIVNKDHHTSFKPGETPLAALPCVKTIQSLITTSPTTNSHSHVKLSRKNLKIKVFTKATTTKFVRQFFENIFLDQIDNNSKSKSKEAIKEKCDVNERRQSSDCCECTSCSGDAVKLGAGTGDLKQNCKKAKCRSMEIDPSDPSDDENAMDIQETVVPTPSCSKNIVHKDIKWIDQLNVLYNNNVCYSSVLVDDVKFSVGDFVTLKSDNATEQLLVAKIITMYDSPVEKFQFHALLFCRAIHTILGDTGEPRELFLTDNCDNLPLGSIIKKAKVDYIKVSPYWSLLGGMLSLRSQLKDNGENYYISKRYEANLNRFIEIDKNELDGTECISCLRREKEKIYNTPTYNESTQEICWREEIYAVGSGVFLDPTIYKFEEDNVIEADEPSRIDVDELLYPEYYRKSGDKIKRSTHTPRPFIIGIIEKILYEQKEISISIRMFWRPEDTKSLFVASKADLTLVYYTETIISTCFSNVKGKCYIRYAENIKKPSQWSLAGPFRFYFEEMFNVDSGKILDAPPNAKKIGLIGKGKGGKLKKTTHLKPTIETAPVWNKLKTPLRAMDIFAGCGGLSEGFRQAGVCQTDWAIESDKITAEAFGMNNQKARIYMDDCNNILKVILDGQADEYSLPAKGAVEMLIGSPPCQSFLGINRFSADQYTLFKNSLVATYLSFCDYYRPKYFVLQTVANLIVFQKGIILKLILACLLKMGYQITWGALRAGNYGVPQLRRRLILMAAAPGYELPKYPEPEHAFSTNEHLISLAVKKCEYINGCYWTQSAPYRAICVRDALSDLPDIKNGWNKVYMPYDENPLTHYQKLMRNDPDCQLVHDHICKRMPPLVSARIAHIPVVPGSDWRDLPNIEVTLDDGKITNLLIYSYKSTKQKNTDPPRSVCKCATGGECDAADYQSGTLIPWSLAHTADRHHNWVGLYGRLEWDGYFRSTIANPDPMGKQGRVLHPNQNRVVSVRECARAQGFPDRFRFHGSIMDKYRQVSNAVPPPVACAIGREILNALVRTNVKNTK